MTRELCNKIEILNINEFFSLEYLYAIFFLDIVGVPFYSDQNGLQTNLLEQKNNRIKELYIIQILLLDLIML